MGAPVYGHNAAKAQFLRLRRGPAHYEPFKTGVAANLARWLIWIQGHRCAYCGCYCPDRYSVDHMTPSGRGGTNDIENLVAACGPCNIAKGASTPLHFLLRMQHRYGRRWNFGWASAFTGSRPPFHQAAA